MSTSSPTSQAARATQDFVPIEEIRDGIVVLKNGGLRLVLIASSLNFALKSEDEQTAILLQYQNFLNSLDFTVQIFVQSRRLDIAPYLLTLEERYKTELNDLIKIQTREYINFVRNFTENTNIMSKSFFVVVPYDPPILNNKSGFIGKLFAKKKNDNEKTSTDQFEERRSQLEQRGGVVSQGLTRLGVRVVQLGTEELVELYFKMFNPGEIEAPNVNL